MSVRELRQTPTFRKAYKKLRDNERKPVNEAIRYIAENPDVGETKVGDLQGVQVYKFRVGDQIFLLAYEQQGDTIILLLAMGVHENFYRELKRTR